MKSDNTSLNRQNELLEQQNSLLERQNELQEQQNDKLERQNISLEGIKVNQRIMASRYALLRRLYALCAILIVIFSIYFAFNYWKRNPSFFTKTNIVSIALDTKSRVDKLYLSFEDKFNTEYAQSLTEYAEYYDEEGVEYVLAPVSDSYKMKPDGYPRVSNNPAKIKTLQLKKKQVAVAKKVEDVLISAKATPYEFALVMALAWHESKFKNISEGKGSRAKSMRNAGGIGIGVMQWTHRGTYISYGVNDRYNITQSVAAALLYVRDLRKNHRKNNKIKEGAYMTSAIFADYNGGMDRGLRLLKKGNRGVKKHNRKSLFAYRAITQ